ncbi:MAG TPA: hypothetical protein VGE06_10185 [Flavisolibacter sp.]
MCSIVATAGIYAQEETLQNHLSKSRDSTGQSFVFAGLESSTTSYINTDTKDSSGVAPFIAAYVNYQHKSNFGLAAKTWFLAKGENKGFYLTSLSAFYANYTARLMPLISYSRYIQHDNASIPYSPIQNEIFAQLRYSTPVLDPSVGVDVGFGNNEENNHETVWDVNAFAGVSRWFSWQDWQAKGFAFFPTIQLNAGTDRYFRFLQTTRYISQNKSYNALTRGLGADGRRRGGSGDTASQEVTYILSESNSFGLSNFEVNAYIEYGFGRISIAPSGSLYFPLRGDNRTAYGYWQININFKLN